MKIVIVILVVVVIVFAVGAWAGFCQPKPPAPSDPEKAGRAHRPSPFEKFLAGLSLPSGNTNPLNKSLYHAGDPKEVIKEAPKTRQVKLRITHRDGCTIPVEYDEDPPHDKMFRQHTQLPWKNDDGDLKDETTLVLMKNSGTLRFLACTAPHKNGCPAKIEVVK